MTDIDELTAAEQARRCAYNDYLKPGKENGPLVIVRAGDVADRIGSSHRLPSVCAALGADTLEKEYSARRVHVHGPLNGANTYFVFDVTNLVT